VVEGVQKKVDPGTTENWKTVQRKRTNSKIKGGLSLEDWLRKSGS